MTTPLRMMSVPVDPRALSRASIERAWTMRRQRNGETVTSGYDEGRALHHLLVETFGPRAAQPFRFMMAPGAKTARLYAYGPDTDTALLARAKETALPEADGIFDLMELRTKDMPEAFAAGRRLAFDVRVRPIVRLDKPLANPREPSKPYKAGAELDAFHVEACRRFPDERPRIVDGELQSSGMEQAGRTRADVYVDWLSARLATAASLVPGTIRLAHYARRRIARAGPGPEGPDVTLHGELEVRDSAAFAQLLANGIGRHKAYGYGMLLLRPASRNANSTG